MPIYEYQCEKCGHRLDALQKVSDDALTECPECEQPALKKLVSAAGFRLKGTGWYETDFKGGSSSKDSGPDTSTPKSTKGSNGGCGSGGCPSC